MSMPTRYVGRHRRVSTRPQRRKLVWATAQITGATVAAGAQIVPTDLLNNLKVAGSSVLGATVMRTHARIEVIQVSTATTEGCGIGFIVDDAGQPGAPAGVPSIGDFGNDWMLLDTMFWGDPGSVVIGGSVFFNHQVDLRSKRRIEELQERYLFCFQNNGNTNVVLSLWCRTLVALA